MRLQFPVFPPVPALSRVLCLAAACALIGCASKNPLIDEPVAAAPAAKPAPAEKPATSAAVPATAAPGATAPVAASQPAPAAQAAPSQPAKAAGVAASGVQTTKEKRLFGIFSPYRIDIQQGNFISQEQVTQLKTGMTPEQVRFLLGTPLLTDIFHANRWDYVFRMQKGSGEVVSSRIAVHFQDNRVASIDAGTLPTEQDYLTLITSDTKPEASRVRRNR